MLYEVTKDDLDLKYFVTSQKSETTKQDLYGIVVEMFSEGIFQESEDTGFITNCHHHAKNLVEILARNSITPLTLLSIVDDILECNKV